VGGFRWLRGRGAAGTCRRDRAWQGRRVLRVSGTLLHSRARSSVPAPLHHQSPSAQCRLGLVPRVLQHRPPSQLGGDDDPGRLRTHRCPARRPQGGGLMSTPTPPGDVSVTPPTCPACGAPLPVGRSRRFCSPAYRQAAYRRRHHTVAAKTQLPGRRSRLEGTIYQCSECETRYLAEQWCPDCARPCQRLGPGGICRQLPGDDHRSGTSPRCLPAPVGMYSECTQNVLSTATNAHRYPTVAAGICAGQRPVPLILNDSHPCEGSSRCTTICEAHKPLTC